MADLPVTPLADYSSMLGIVPQNVSGALGATATRELQGAQTQGLELQNQRTSMQLGYMQQLIDSMKQSQTPAANDTGGGATDTTGVPGGQQPAAPGASSTADAADVGDDTHTSLAAAGLDPDHITANAQQKFAVKDIWTPQEQLQLRLATVSGVPGAADMIKAQHDARVHNAMATAQLGASRAYDESYSISNAPDGAALTTLERVHPDAAQSVQQLAKARGWTPQQTDSFVRMYADEVGNAVHRYSGRDIEVGKDGIARDKETQQEVLGANPVGLSADEHATLMQEAMKPVTIKQGDHEVQIPQWQYAGAPSASAYVNRAAIRNRAQAAQTAPPGTAPAGAAAPAPAAGAPSGVARPAEAGAAASPAAPAVADPQLRTALADSNYRTPLPPERTGVSMGPADLEAKKSYVTAKNELLKDTGFNAKVSGAALVYMNAAKSILDAGGVTTGIGSEAITTVNRLARQLGLKGGLTADPSNNIALVKNLVNAGLQNIKATFGPRVTANEVFLNLNKANPSADMPEEALRTLINENTQIAKYDIDTSRRAQAYVGNGVTPLNDPHRFDDWNQQYFPKEKAVSVSNPAATTTPPKTAAGTQSGPMRSKSGHEIWMNPKTNRLEYK